MDISLRQAHKKDYKFLWGLHKATMESYVDKVWGWDEHFQKTYFNDRFETRNIQIIQNHGMSIGAIEILSKESELFIADVKILPNYQNRGIGTTVLNRIINASHTNHKRVRLQVLKVNPAKRFYDRMNFEVVGETETHFIMAKRLL